MRYIWHMALPRTSCWWSDDYYLATNAKEKQHQYFWNNLIHRVQPQRIWPFKHFGILNIFGLYPSPNFLVGVPTCIQGTNHQNHHRRLWNLQLWSLGIRRLRWRSHVALSLVGHSHDPSAAVKAELVYRSLLKLVYLGEAEPYDRIDWLECCWIWSAWTTQQAHDVLCFILWDF